MDSPNQNIFVVLKTGGDFTMEHVDRLYKQLIRSGALVDRFMVLLTDDPNPLQHPRLVSLTYPELGPKWWGKIDAMKLCGQSGMWMVDLDTTIFEWPETPKVSTFNADFYNQGRYGSGFFFMTKEDAQSVFDRYRFIGPEKVQEIFRPGLDVATLGDQAFIASVLGSKDIFPESVVCSYKKHIRPGVKVPTTAKVVCFHGKPRPWSIPELTK